MKRMIKAAIASIPSYTHSTIIKRIGDYPVVSFDIYDTLIKRNVYEPSDIFRLAVRAYNEDYENASEGKLDEAEFFHNRIAAERRTRDRNTESEEIDIDSIYRELNGIYREKVPDVERTLNRLKELELEFELSCSYANPEMKPVYDWCIENGKKIIIISDMYLPQECILKILNRNGYNGFRLYLSSAIGLQKKTGNIYEYVVRDGYAGKSVVHIGDDLIGDYLQAKKHKIGAVWIGKQPQRIEYGKKIYIRRNRTWRKLGVLLDNALPAVCNPYYQYGFEVFGPLLYGFTRWLISNISEDGIHSVWFLSRDGYIMLKAYNELQNKNEGKYFYGSRKAFQVAMLWLHPDIEYFSSLYPATKVWTVKDISRKTGVNISICEEAWIRSGIRPEDMIKNSELSSNGNVRKFWGIISESMIENSKEQYRFLCEYVAQNKLDGDVAIVDIGWHGTMQRCLQEMAHREKWDINFYGYYLGTADRLPDDISIKYYIPKQERPTEGLMGILEMLFPSDEGSVIGYKKTERAVVPMLDFPECSDRTTCKFLREVQKGALEFVRTFRTNSLLELGGHDAFLSIKRIGNRPTQKEAKMLGDCMFMDDGLIRMAKPDTLLNYLTHRKNFRYDFAKCPWKIGFVKRMLKVPLPYDKLFRFAKIYAEARSALNNMEKDVRK